MSANRSDNAGPPPMNKVDDKVIGAHTVTHSVAVKLTGFAHIECPRCEDGTLFVYVLPDNKGVKVEHVVADDEPSEGGP